MSTITGTKITSLPKASSIGVDDLFLLSEPTDMNCQFYDNRKLSYYDLCSYLSGRFILNYRFKSMAYEDENDYALSGHNHDGVYDKTTITPLINSGIKVADFIIREKQSEESGYKQTTVPVYFPNIVIQQNDEPYIGELKFFTPPPDNKVSDVDIFGSDFDGWVYPHGQSYTVGVDQFLSACYVFNGNKNATSFTLPNLSYFFKGATTTDLTSIVNGVYKIPKHTHRIIPTLEDKECKSTIVIRVSSGFDKGEYSHIKGEAKHTYTINDFKLRISKFEIENSNPRTDQAGNEYGYTYPTYNHIPVMIYIGKK